MRPSRDSTTDGPANRRSGERKCTSFDRFAHPLGEADGRVQRGTGQDEHELLAAVAAYPVDLARVVTQDPGELAQHLIAGLMSVGVVDTLEHVEVAHDARERLTETERMLERLFQPLFEPPAVVDAGKSVGARDAHELVVDGEQLGALALDFLLQRFGTEQRPDPRLELGETNRLGDVIIGAGVETDHLVFRRIKGGLHDDRNERQALVGLDAPRHLEAVDLRQHHVEQDQVGERLGSAGRRTERRDDGERFLAVVGDHRRVPASLEVVLQDRDVVGVVVDDQDARGRAASRYAT
jgi:hypothetical protein